MTKLSRHSLLRALLPGVLAVGALTLAGCPDPNANKAGGGTTGSAQAGAATQNTNVTEIKIGEYVSETGETSTFGVESHAGLQFAVDQLNAAGGIDVGGKKMKVVVDKQDDRSLAEEAKTIAVKFAADNDIVAVVGEVASSRSKTAAPELQRAGVPMVSPSSTNPEVTKVGDYIFRVCFIDPFQGFVCAKFATDNLKARNAAVLVDQASAYSVGLADEFTKNFEKLGGKIVTTQAYTKGEQDFTARLTAIRDKGPDVVFVPGYYTDVANVAIQARKLGINAPLLGGDGWDSEELCKNAGKAIEGSYYSNHAAPDDPSEKIQGFIAKYKDEYGATPDALACLGYDAANLLGQALKASHGQGGKALRDAIAATKDFPGVTGTLNFNATRDAIKPAVILELKDGKPKFVATIKP